MVITLLKLITGYFLNSSSLIADGFNNLSDILGNVVLLIGLHLASKPADEDHRFGHWKMEDLSSLITSFIMFYIGFKVLFQTIEKIISGSMTPLDPEGAVVGVISAAIMYSVYLHNKRLSQRVKSSALLAASKDNLSDAVTSIGTSVAILAASFNLVIIDRLAAIVITYFILKTAYDIFIESAFSLSDGFDQKELQKYKEAILKLPKVSNVKSQRGRSYGSNIYLDIVVEMNPDLSVYESHEVTEQIEEILRKEFSVYDTDVHVEPGAIPEDEIWDNVYKKLYKAEKTILAKIPDYENLISDDSTLSMLTVIPITNLKWLPEKDTTWVRSKILKWHLSVKKQSLSLTSSIIWLIQVSGATRKTGSLSSTKSLHKQQILKINRKTRTNTPGFLDA